MKNNRKGFTLIELLVVIAIIALLSTLAVLALNNARRDARDSKRQADLRTVESALALHANNASTYPVGGTTWTVLETTLAPFLASSQLPEDPTGTGAQRYMYCADATGSKYMLAVTLEDTTNTDIEGDTDGTPTYADTSCMLETDVNPPAVPSCNDPAFCLGTL